MNTSSFCWYELCSNNSVVKKVIILRLSRLLITKVDEDDNDVDVEGESVDSIWLSFDFIMWMKSNIESVDLLKR